MTPTPYLDDGDLTLYHGDAATILQQLPAGIAQTCVTSPPYWQLRDYGTADQLGLEPTPEQYVDRLVSILSDVRRVLRDDGTLWLVIGDSYAGSSGSGGHTARQVTNVGSFHNAGVRMPEGLKPKDLVGIPWRVAFALQADGWYLRADVIWSKPNPMTESVTDRPSKAHEYVFLLAKSRLYYYDADAVREPHQHDGRRQVLHLHGTPNSHPNYDHIGNGNARWPNSGRNRRSVWTVAAEPYPDAHFATYPTALVTPCILAGSAAGDTVIDPFIGSGTTALVARHHGRRAIGIDLSSEYLEMAAKRTRQLSLLSSEEAT